MNIERRLFTIAIRAEGDAPKITGHAAVFNTPADLGCFREQIAPGAFREAITRDDVKCLFNHNPDFVLGRNRAGTLRLSEDEVGLYFECDPPDTQWGRDLVVSMKRGDISQCSFGFIPTKQQWDETGKVPVRTIQACQLFDVSPVTYPAYASTECQARSAEDVLLEHRAANLEQPTVPDYRIDLAAKLAVISALTATDF
jgi:hypothetical protein